MDIDANNGKRTSSVLIISDDDEQEDLANAQLIAAAPDQNQALKKLLKVCEDVVDDFGSYRANDGRNQIEKDERQRFFMNEVLRHISKLAEAVEEGIAAIQKAEGK